MAPAESQQHGVLGGQRPITTVAIDLQNPDEAVEMGHWALRFAVRCIDINDTRRIASLPRSIITRIGPELARFSLAAPRIEHRSCRLVGKKL